MRTVLKLTAAALLAGCALTPRVQPAGEPVWVERETYLMGAPLRIRVAAASRVAGNAAIEAGFGEVRRLERVLSSWSDTTEIGRINVAAVGEAVPVSEELWALLEEARAWRARTGGAFDPGVGALTDAWGLRAEGRRPNEEELAEALAKTGMDCFRFDAPGRSVVKSDAGAWLDTGGFGKGAALDSAAGVLRRMGVTAGILDFGGQVLVFGRPPEGGAWEVAVAHPSHRMEATTSLRLAGGSASTSSQSERFVEGDAERSGHVIDPRSGRPVPAWGSVTVVAPSALEADVLSTALFVMGPVAGRRWAERLEGVGVLFLEEREGRVVSSWNSAYEEFR